MRQVRGLLVAVVSLTASVIVARPAGGLGQVPVHRKITFIQIEGEPGAELSARGHVIYVRRDGPGDATPFQAYRWFRGEEIALTPNLPDGVSAGPTDVNERGDVVGYRSDGDRGDQGWAWNAGELRMLLGRAPLEVNDRGLLLYNQLDPDGRTRAGVLLGDRAATSPRVLGDENLIGVDVNNHGEVATQAYSYLPFLWRPGETPVALGTLGGSMASPVDINDHGTVVGTSEMPDHEFHGFIWRQGHMTDLGTLGGATSVVTGSTTALNQRDQVIGYGTTADGLTHGFIWTDGQLRDLGTLGGATCLPSGVNDRGEVVGVSDTASGEWHAFLWRAGTMIDLGATTGRPDTSASDINDRGQVVGYERDGDHGSIVLWETRGRG